jgi:hypothetical protein
MSLGRAHTSESGDSLWPWWVFCFQMPWYTLETSHQERSSPLPQCNVHTFTAIIWACDRTLCFLRSSDLVECLPKNLKTWKTNNLEKWQLSLSELVWSAFFCSIWQEDEPFQLWYLTVSCHMCRSSRPAALTPSIALLKSPETFTPSGFLEDLGGSLVDINWPFDIFGTC